MTEPKPYTNYRDLLIVAVVIWFILFAAFLRQAYIRISEEESLTIPTTSMQVDYLPRILK